jgi:hypothetical protein
MGITNLQYTVVGCDIIFRSRGKTSFKHVTEKFLPASRFLRNQQAGFGIDLRSTFSNKDPRKDIITSWLESSMIFSASYLTQDLFDFEQDELSKIGPISIRLPSPERIAQIQPYFAQKKFSPTKDAAAYARKKLFSLLEKGRLRPISLQEAFDRSDKSTNWGLQHFSRGEIFGQYYLDDAYELLNSLDVSSVPPCVLGWRGQFSGTIIPKQRTVWLYPHAMSLIEKMYFDPLLVPFKRMEGFRMLHNQDTVAADITKILSKADSLGVKAIGIDFASFDASIPYEILNDVFEAFIYWYQKGNEPTLRFIQQYFCTSGLLTPERLMTGRVGGVPSGSTFTNLIDSLVQFWCFSYCTYKVGLHSADCCTVMGDDGVWLSIHLTPVIVGTLLAPLNFSCNEDKMYWRFRCVTFCKLLFSLDYLVNGIAFGIRSTIRCINGMMSHEYPVRSIKYGTFEDFNAMRWISQVENCKRHPLFTKLITFAVKGCPIGLGTKLPGGIISLFSKNRSLAEVFAFFNDRFRITNQVKAGQDVYSLNTVVQLINYT